MFVVIIGVSPRFSVGFVLAQQTSAEGGLFALLDTRGFSSAQSSEKSDLSLSGCK